MVDIYVSEDPYISYVLVQMVTKSGHYYNRSEAWRDIGGGRVTINGYVHNELHTILEPGIYAVNIGDSKYTIRVNNNAYEA